MATGRKFGWHSGTVTALDGKFKRDVYVQDDIVFSDVSAGVLGVTGGIDMSGTTSATGIDMGGTYSTQAILIDGTCGAAINETVSDATTNPSRLNYWQYTLTGNMSSGGATALEIRSTFNGSATTSNSVTGAEIKARHTTGNTKTVGQLRGVVGNADVKNGTATTAYGIEASIDVSAGGKITTGALIHANLNNSGTVTNSYGAYIEGVSGYNIGTGIYMRYITTGIELAACTTGINLSGAFTTAGINIADITSMEGNAKAGIKIGSWGTPLNTIATMTDNIRLFQGSVQCVDGPASGYKEVAIFSAEVQTDGTHDLTYVDFSPIHTKSTINRVIGWHYGIQADVFKTGSHNCGDFHAITGYIDVEDATTFTASGRFAPLSLILSSSGGGGSPSITGDVAVAWIGARGHINADAILWLHCQSTANATDGIYFEIGSGRLTNVLKVNGGTTYFMDLDNATTFVTSGGTDCTASGATDPGYTIKLKMPDGGDGYIRVWDSA